MSEENELQKYFTIQKLIEHPQIESVEFFETMVNDAVEQGYKVHTFQVVYEPSEFQGVGYRRYIALMSLSSDSKYDNITNLIDITPDQVDVFLANGWVVADSWSKVVRMVRKVDTSNTKMIKEDE